MSCDAVPGFDTLRVLHLPPCLSDERRNELFQRYGAVRTRTVRPSSKYTITFARFLSHEAATEAFLRLHQLKIRGKYLSVEFAKKSLSTELIGDEVHHKDVSNNEEKKEAMSKSHFQAFLHRLNSWTMNQMFTGPPPPNIRYKYAPPMRSTLLRIVVQLIKEPVFYTQVLHLMNRMNLPPPFEELESEFPLLKEVYNLEKYQHIFDKNIAEEVEDIEEEESEIESEEDNVNKLVDIVPTKRRRPQSAKRLKIPKFVNPMKHANTLTTQKSIKPEEMFEPVQRGETKNLKIELKTVNKLLETADRVSATSTDDTVKIDGGFGLMFPVKNTDETAINEECEVHRPQDEITAEELASNRISVNDQRLLPVFKNYHPGKPSNRLYIKNLAKQVELTDLHFIYKKFVVSALENAEAEYDVRLMQEGRMKGQAFVTLQNIKRAQLALDETNGYILKEKPMVVQFAKAAKN